MWKISLHLMNLASAESRDAFVWTRKKHEDRSRDININLIRQMFKGIQLRFFRRIQTDFELRTRRMFCGTRLRANWSEMPLILLRLVVGWHFEKSHFINILMSRHPCDCESSTFPFKHLVKHFSQSFRLEERGKETILIFHLLCDAAIFHHSQKNTQDRGEGKVFLVLHSTFLLQDWLRERPKINTERHFKSSRSNARERYSDFRGSFFFLFSVFHSNTAEMRRELSFEWRKKGKKAFCEFHMRSGGECVYGKGT